MSERLKPNRRGTWLSAAFGTVAAVIGVAMVTSSNYAGIVVLVLAAVGVYGAIGGLWPGVGLYLDEQGFCLRTFGKSWRAEWLEIERFEPEKVRVGRREDVEVVHVHYLGDAHAPRTKLGETIGIDERYVVAAWGGLSNTELAAKLESYRSGARA